MKISDIELMNSAFVLSEYYGSVVRPKNIVYNTYIGRRSNLHSKPTLIHGPVQNTEIFSLS